MYEKMDPLLFVRSQVIEIHDQMHKFIKIIHVVLATIII